MLGLVAHGDDMDMLPVQIQSSGRRSPSEKCPPEFSGIRNWSQMRPDTDCDIPNIDLELDSA